MSEVIDSKEELKERRGRMLQVLCILSWIYIGLYFVFMLPGLFQGQSSSEEMAERKIAIIEMAEAFNLSKEQVQESVLIDERNNEHFYLDYSSSIVFCLIGFISVLQMWRLQKAGYWMYIVYSLAPIGISFYIKQGLDSAVTSAIMAVLFSGVFIILYGTQLKRME